MSKSARFRVFREHLNWFALTARQLAICPLATACYYLQNYTDNQCVTALMAARSCFHDKPQALILPPVFY